MPAADYLSAVPQGAADPILGIAQAYKECTSEKKVNVAVGAYRTNEGVPWVLPSVAEAEKRLCERGEKKEYAGITGVPSFVTHALRFAYGAESEALLSGRIAGAQSLSGTGALRIAAEFYRRFLPATTEVHISDPTWGNHIKIFEAAGMVVKKYRYLDRASNKLDADGMLADIAAAPAGSVILLHACAHNPTGIDPTAEQWKAISAAVKQGGHHVLMDSAYQGFASGDAEADAAALRQFVDEGHSMLLSQSFAKNFGLYGERVGTLSVVCRDAAECARVTSQLKLIIRPMYSSPPIHGALLVAEVLDDVTLAAQYYRECASMAARIKEMRGTLRGALGKTGSTLDWAHVESQIGMFAYTGLTADECDAMTGEYHVYLTRDGRISMAGINTGNVQYVADAMHAVTAKRA